MRLLVALCAPLPVARRLFFARALQALQRVASGGYSGLSVQENVRLRFRARSPDEQQATQVCRSRFRARSRGGRRKRLRPFVLVDGTGGGLRPNEA